MTNKIFLFIFFLNSNPSLLVKYVPVGLLGLAIKTILVFFVIFYKITFTETIKLFSFAKTTFAPTIFE